LTLKALLLNCTLKKSPDPSNTEALMDRVIEVLESLDVECEKVRVVDHDIPFGVSSDMGDGDEWPPILEKVLAADILILGMPIWFGVRSSVAQMVIERLDGTYNTTNEVGQYPLYNTVAGVVNLSHLGCTIPPNADTYWLGDAGPGPSYIEAEGWNHAYTQKTTSWMAHNVVHLARMLKERPIPPDGNTVPGWQPEDCTPEERRRQGAGHLG
jgi:NADPH-dependent FMN reductase